MAVKTVKVALGFPWYNGPDPHCSVYFGEFMAYLGRLQERSAWIAKDFEGARTVEEHSWREYGCSIEEYLDALPKLDPHNTTGLSEITPDLVGTKFEFATCQEMFLSLVGMARERIVEACLEWGADYVLWSDDDMIFGTDIFLRLYKHQLPVCGALAFTSRKPLQPVIFAFTKKFDEEKGREITDIQPVMDYKRDALQKVDAIGSGVMLTKADVFTQIGKPWFSSYGLGEDIFFCHRLGEHGIPVHVDTTAKTIHKAMQPVWHDEGVFLAQQGVS